MRQLTQDTSDKYDNSWDCTTFPRKDIPSILKESLVLGSLSYQSPYRFQVIHQWFKALVLNVEEERIPTLVEVDVQV